MITVEEAVTVHRPRKEVWDYVTDPANFPVWLGHVAEYQADWDKHPQVGDRARAVSKFAGRRVKSTQEVIEVAPAETFAFKSVEGAFDYEDTIGFQDAADGTQVTFRAETPGMGGPLGRLTRPLVTRMFRKELRSSLDTLKTLLEKA